MTYDSFGELLALLLEDVVHLSEMRVRQHQVRVQSIPGIVYSGRLVCMTTVHRVLVVQLALLRIRATRSG